VSLISLISSEHSTDVRKYESHKNILDPEGNPILQETHNYITIRGYFNGPDQWVADHSDSLYTPVDLSKVPYRVFITESECERLLKKVKERLKSAGYDGSLLKSNDILLAVDDVGNIMRSASGNPEVIICNFEMIWKIA
jgi:hypothetical protein